jgi:peptidoglycan/xylan/chitin deacetylase (PgdA/CDA1 family)
MLKKTQKLYIDYNKLVLMGGVLVIKYKRQLLFIVFGILLISLFTYTVYGNKKQINLLSDKIAELEKSKEELTSNTEELKENNEKLNSEAIDLKEINKKLNLEIEELKANNQKLLETNDTLHKENANLKKKLGTSSENKPSATNNGADKTAYLTFDDGPSDNTVKILDILKENNIKATFFVNGRPESKEIYKRIVNEGHTIGNHTYSHDYAALYKTIDGFYKDKQKLDDLIWEVNGVKPEILRFPGGSNNHVSYSYGGKDFMDKLTKQVKESGIKYFDWNVDSSDASTVTQDKNKIISAVLNGSKNKTQAIILMHDSKPKTTTALALPDIIKGLKEQGFKFSSLSSKVSAVQFK